MEHHPSQANHFLVGRVGSIYLTTDGSKFVKQATPAFLGTGGTPEVAALAYSPSSPGTDWWFVTTQAQFFMTQNSGTLWTDVTPPDLAAVLAAGGPPNFILAQAGTDVAIHPTDPRIVVVTVGMMPGGRVYVTGDKGATWREMSGNGVGATAVAVPVADRLNPSAAMCVAFDPSTPAAGAQTVYVGTLAGIYVCRDLTPPVAAAPNPPAPHWRTFNNNLPLTLIYDIVPVTVRDAANNVVRTALRCGTHGRGIYECQLSPAPARPVELYIRQTPISDGRLYVGPANVANDPRLSAATPMRFDRAYDVRVGNPPFAEFESRVDGAEFDEMLFNTVPTAGLKNTVFVQVHTNGHQENPPNVRVDLYFANAPNEPPTVPDLHANFWAAYPGNPPAGDWRRAGTEFVTGLGAGQPVVARFEWVPPLDVGRQVALLALCTRPEAAPGDANADDLKAAAPTTVMAPTNPASLVRTERRAALRVTAMDFSFPSVFVREDINDAGLPGSVAWGGQGADIIVRPGPEADPDHAFADLGDRRSADLMIGNVTNHVYIRVSNRMDLEMSAHVELFRAPSETLDKAGTWVQIGARADVDNIAPKGSKLSVPFQIANPVDPSPAADVEYKVMYLIAIVTPKGAPSPSRASVTDFTTFWKFLTQGIANTDMSATCRGVRWKATA
jgi:hypothetical protein